MWQGLKKILRTKQALSRRLSIVAAAMEERLLHAAAEGLHSARGERPGRRHGEGRRHGTQPPRPAGRRELRYVEQMNVSMRFMGI